MYLDLSRLHIIPAFSQILGYINLQPLTNEYTVFVFMQNT